MTLKQVLTGVAAAMAAASTANAQSLLCDNGAEERIIEVIKPGNVGRACDLRVVSDGGETVSVPYNANNQESYCEARIPDVVKMLATSNFKCAVTQTFAEAQVEAASPVEPAASAASEKTSLSQSTVAAPVDAEAVAPLASASDFSPESDSQISTPEAQQVVQTSAPAEVATNDATETDRGEAFNETYIAGARPQEIAEELLTPNASGSLDAQYASENFAEVAPFGLADAEVVESRDQSNDLSAVLDQPQANFEEATQSYSSVATGAPMQLADQQKIAQVNASRPARPAAGLVAAPAPTTAPEPIVERVVVTPGRPLTSDRAAAQAATAKSSSVSATELVGAGRPAADIIRSVLMAQVAAWNDGDMEAFLAGYWNDPELRFVSGNDVTIGWRNVAKRYRERYSTPAQMGVLRFNEIDVDLVDNGVAVVVGRFTHQSELGGQEGSFSLVMRQIGGLWRIVHDHTTTDSAPTAMRDL